MIKRISVVTPIYHGKQYINQMICQLEACARESMYSYTLELLLVNDDPEEPLEQHVSDMIDIKVIQTDCNRGIHAARVLGLECSTGSYILFLDQDDLIQPDYFHSQLKCMGENDAVVCRLIHEGKQFYNNRMPFEAVMSREYFISVRNPVISPGQVLIRRNKIPDFWKRTCLKNNGADDWLLWLCMTGANCRFALNQDILFEHVVLGNNESVNMKHMMDSEEEVLRVLTAGGVLGTKELEIFQDTVKRTAQWHIETLCRFQKMFYVCNEWLELQERGIQIYDYLKKTGIRKTAIYAAGYIGKRLYHNLKNNGIEVSYFIDINAQYLDEDIPVYLPDAYLPSVDMVIVSLVEDEKHIMDRLSCVPGAEIRSIKQLFDEMRSMSEAVAYWRT